MYGTIAQYVGGTGVVPGTQVITVRVPVAVLVVHVGTGTSMSCVTGTLVMTNLPSDWIEQTSRLLGSALLMKVTRP